MASNGCGHWGTVSHVWLVATGRRPPFEGCCDEHDLAYEQATTAEERAWADAHFRRCTARHGYHVSGAMMWAAVRIFGGMFNRR